MHRKKARTITYKPKPRTRWFGKIGFQRALPFLKIDRSILLPLVFAAVALVVAIPILTYVYFAADLSSKESIMNRNDTGVVLLDRKDRPFFTFYEGRTSSIVTLDKFPKTLRDAVVAAEDKDFYKHSGFSVTAIAASFLANVRNESLAYGGSTITQQLVKYDLLTSQKSFLRKYQELVLAYEIERRFTKDEILEMYLNSVYFGEGAYGAADAAQLYFGKDVSKISLEESALLAALPNAPSQLSPLTGNKEQLKGRYQFVLNEMKQQGTVTSSEVEKAWTHAFVYTGKKDQEPTRAPHFALMVKEELIKQFGEESISRSGFKVHTTLDLDWQSYTEDQVYKQVKNLAGSKVGNGAAVVEDVKTGEIRALVGSYNWYDENYGKVNIATTPRQPGSSFKPIVYLDALENHQITPATVLHDKPVSFPGSGGTSYTPQNYDGKYRGDVLVRRALANSLNIPAIEVLQKVGIPEALDMAQRLGITTLGDSSKYGLSLVLGAGEVPLAEMTNAYATLAANGMHAEPLLITKIDDKNGKQVFTASAQTKKVIDPEYPFLISSILSDNSARAEGFGSALSISRAAAVKTGTTNDYKDSWTIGYTPSLAVGVWIGNNDNKQMDRVAGSIGAAPIWRALMEKFLAGTPVEQFTPPPGVATAFVCRNDGKLFRDTVATSSAMKEYFYQGTQPTEPCVVATPVPSPTPTVVVPVQGTTQYEEYLRQQQKDKEKQQEASEEAVRDQLRRFRESVRDRARGNEEFNSN